MVRCSYGVGVRLSAIAACLFRIISQPLRCTVLGVDCVEIFMGLLVVWDAVIRALSL